MPNILLIEDNPGDARLIRELLKEVDTPNWSHSIQHVERVRDAVDILSQPHTVDIILSDITLPDSQGVDTFELLQSAAVELPVLFMTGSNDERLALDAMHRGAQDYLIKGRIASEVLARSISFAMERKKFQNELTKVTALAQENAQHVMMLSQQKQQLLALNKSKDEFIALASHQLRTPATAVKQYIGMITEGYVGDVDERQLALLQTAYESNDRQLTIINDLLRTAQLDANTYQLSLKKENLNQLVEEVIADHAPITKLRGQTVIFKPRHEYFAMVDREEMKLVLVNIIENASKYTPPDKKITIKLSVTKQHVLIAVIDQGVGMKQSDLKRIFEKFTRVDNDMSDTVAGNGLGLYWVQRIMRLHKGKIEVSSVVGEGSTFTLVLPALKADEDDHQT